MAFWYERVIRPLLFRWEAERAHEAAVQAMALAAALPPLRGALHWRGHVGVPAAPVKLFGLTFPNRVGVAAGFDKNAVCWRALAALGFGHVEVGTVTLQRQPGNPRPRVFRFPADEALINRMGFNNDGAEEVARRLARGPRVGRRSVPVGVNLGKSRVAPLDEAVADYLGSFRLLADHADYVAINVSSPNTPELRQLQEEERLRALLAALQEANRARGDAARPLLLKIAPDLSFPQIDAILQAIVDFKLDGVIATNTTLARAGAFLHNTETGGLSGRPLRAHATEIVDYIARRMRGKLPIIGVGGIDDPVSAAEKLDAGASLVQVYTGMIFRGPWLGREIARALAPRDQPWVFRQ